MPKKNFCGVGNFPVLVPYEDLEKLLDVARTQEEILHKCQQIEKRCAAMQLMYSEVLEKIAEINRLL